MTSRRIPTNLPGDDPNPRPLWVWALIVVGILFVVVPWWRGMLALYVDVFGA